MICCDEQEHMRTSIYPNTHTHTYLAPFVRISIGIMHSQIPTLNIENHVLRLKQSYGVVKNSQICSYIARNVLTLQ